MPEKMEWPKGVPYEDKSPKGCDGYTVMRWSETIALLKRLGFEWEARTTKLTLIMEEGQVVKLVHEYTACQPKNYMDVTNFRNEEFTTILPILVNSKDSKQP